MRILQVSHDFLPGHRAGAEIYTYNLCREMARTGHDIHLFFTEHKPAMPQYSSREGLFGDIHYTEVVNNHCQKRFEETYNNPRMDEIFRSLIDSFKPDVMHIQHLLYHSTNYPRIASEAGIPSVMTLHDFWLICEQEGKRMRAYFPGESHDDAWKGERFGCVKLCDEIVAADCAKCWNRRPTLAGGLERAGGLALRAARRLLGLDLTAMARRHYEKMRPDAASPEASPPKGPLAAADITRRNDYIRDALAHVSRFICPSRFLAKEMKRYGYPEEKLLVSDYGFRTEAFDDFRRTVGDGIRFGYVGTPAELKGVHVLVKAFRELAADNASLEIFGDTQTFPQYTAWLRGLAGDARVSFHGRFAPDAVAEVFSQIDVLVVPSIWFENSPLVIHEAFMSRTPVIASNLGGMADLVENGVSGLLFKPGDYKDLAAKMRALLEEPAMIENLAGAAPRVKTVAEDAESLERLYGSCRP